ncbi:MAG: hypothetical protein QOD36_3346, partial [Mycobacterium sp.]|nr:hypothetical protein [Mycobacterium sp.]
AEKTEAAPRSRQGSEIVEDLTVMSNNDRPGHSYIDISTPTNTLVLARDEYVRVVPPS